MTVQQRKIGLIKKMEGLRDERSTELPGSDLQLAGKLDPALELSDEDYSEVLEDIAADPASDTLSESEFWQTVGRWGSK